MRRPKVKKLLVNFLLTRQQDEGRDDDKRLHYSSPRVIKGTPMAWKKAGLPGLQTRGNRIVMPPARR
jgi:hypothetical protein